MDCGRLSDRVRFISLISISGLHFHFHLLGSLLAISPFICSRREWAARPSGRPLSDRCLRLPDETAETSGRWGGGGTGGLGGYHRGGRGHFTLMTSAGRNPPLDSGSVWKCARGLRRVALCVRVSASHL